jgi:hypothetical protein
MRGRRAIRGQWMRPEPFYGVGASYEDFSQMSDAEVIDLLERARSCTAPFLAESSVAICAARRCFLDL